MTEMIVCNGKLVTLREARRGEETIAVAEGAIRHAVLHNQGHTTTSEDLKGTAPGCQLEEARMDWQMGGAGNGLGADCNCRGCRERHDSGCTPPFSPRICGLVVWCD